MSTQYLEKQTLVVKCITSETDAINTYELASADGSALPAVTAGDHLMFHLDNGLVRQYSLINAAGETDSYSVSILRDSASRGGSAYFHESVQVGSELVMSGPKNHFPLVLGAEKSLLIGGGIGVTPLLSMAETLASAGENFELHYCARSAADAAFVEYLKATPYADSVSFHFTAGDASKRLDLTALLQTIEPGQHLFCCGPESLMDAVAEAAAHWPRGSVHFERFKAGSEQVFEDKAFEIYLEKSDLTLAVPAEKTVLEVLNENEFEIDMVCGEGVCGACLVNVSDGDIEHRDHVLTDDEKVSNDIMTVCCSRAKSASLSLEL